MPKKHFFPDAIIAQLLWFTKFVEHIGAFATKYGITSAQQTTLNDDKEYLSFWYGVQQGAENLAHQCAVFRQELANGVKPGHVASEEPTIPTFGTIPTAVAPGIYSRDLAIANQIKNHPNYNPADGVPMGLEGEEHVFDPAAGKPVMSVKFTGDGFPQFHVKKGDFDGWMLWEDAGAGFVKVDKVMHPNYINHNPLPAPGLSQTRRYKAQYMYKDQLVGMESDVKSISVFGGAV
jgi:hypothetical protein